MSCNLNVDDNKNELIHKRLEQEIKNLANDLNAKVLMQKGAIAELCEYIKGNLTNTLRTLLDDMKYSGELDTIITEAVLSAMQYVEDGVYPAGHITKYGAVGDGVTDDTLAIKQAIEDAKSTGKPLIAGDGTYRITEDIDMRYIKNISFKGEIVGDNVVLIGNKSGDFEGCYFDFNKVDHLKIVGIKNSIIRVNYVNHLELYANGDDETMSSIGYCQFYGAYAKKITIFSEGTNIGWINENVFRIKRIEEIHIDGNYDHNNNHFEHCNLEKGKLTLNNCRNNHFSARCEGGITVNTADGALGSLIEKEHYYNHYFGNDLDNHGGNVYGYYDIQKLQTEETLLLIDKNHKSFPVGSLYFSSDGTFTGENFNEIYHSDLIKIEDIFALKVKSNAKNIRVRLNFYDENKTRITDKVNNYADGRMSYLASGDWSYMVQANVNEDIVVIYPGTAKYVEYNVIFGSASLPMNYLQVKLVKLIGTDVIVSDKLKHNVYKSLPTKGYWERGTILYVDTPKKGGCIGVVAMNSGTYTDWKNFGEVK